MFLKLTALMYFAVTKHKSLLHHKSLNWRNILISNNKNKQYECRAMLNQTDEIHILEMDADIYTVVTN